MKKPIDLIQLIRDLKVALEFDAEYCDFGPSLGMWEDDKRDALRRARSVLREHRKDPTKAGIYLASPQ